MKLWRDKLGCPVTQQSIEKESLTLLQVWPSEVINGDPEKKVWHTKLSG